MTYFYIALGLLVVGLHSFLLFSHSKDVLINYNINKNLIIIFSVLNATVIGAIYYWGFAFNELYVSFYLVFFLELSYIFKKNYRAAWFVSSNYLLNMCTLHMLVLATTSIITGLTIKEIYYTTNLFFICLIIAFLLLCLFSMFIVRVLPINKLKNLSTSKIYSELMSGICLLLLGFIAWDTWQMLDDKTSVVYLFSTITSCIFALVLYYFFFYFNANLILLHRYKRKADEIKTLHNKVVEQKQRTEFKLYTDDLTNLYNKRYIYAKIDEICEENTTNFGLIYSDIVALKNVNDTYGHKIGDEYIIKVSNIFKNTLRAEDICARLGGDEFLILIYGISESELELVIERLKLKFNEQNKKEEYMFYANLGYKHFKESAQGKTRGDLIQMVDERLNADKEMFYKKGGAKI